MWHLPVDPFKIVRHEGIMLRAGDYGGTFDARIEFYPNLKRFCIFHADPGGWRTVGRVRFSIAHEVGHFYLPAHRERLLKGIMHNSVTDFGSRSPTEIEADEFAADLLMPMGLFRAELNLFRNGFCDLDDLTRLADRLGTSITSTARRYCESDREPCTIFFSEGGMVRWGHSSADMQRTGMFYYQYNTPPPRGSKTDEFWSLVNDGGDPEKMSARVPSQVWFQWPRASYLWEEVMPLGNTGRVITQLTPDD
jgi:hypothetical protein